MGLLLPAMLGSTGSAFADVSAETIESLSVPNSVETSIGTLEFKDGIPSAETAQTIYDTLDFTNALNVSNNSFRGASALAMVMRIPEVGSQYLIAFLDDHGDPFDGAKVYKVTLPKDIPARAFWSFTAYDNQTRSMLQTPQKYPRAGSQSYPSPAAEAAEDGTTTVWFAPEQPEGVARGNWIQTDPNKGWFTALRLYSPFPSFFSKEWQPSEIQLVN